MLAKCGIPPEAVRSLWDFENKGDWPLKKIAAFRLCRAAATSPNAVEPAHHHEMHQHFSDQEFQWPSSPTKRRPIGRMNIFQRSAGRWASIREVMKSADLTCSKNLSAILGQPAGEAFL